MWGKVKKNGTTDLAGSEKYVGEDADSALARAFYATLSTNEYITFQIKEDPSDSAETELQANAILTIQKV